MTCGSRLSVHLGQEITTPWCHSAVPFLPMLPPTGLADSATGTGMANALLLAANTSSNAPPEPVTMAFATTHPGLYALLCEHSLGT